MKVRTCGRDQHPGRMSRVREGHNGEEKKTIALFHVSKHSEHFKSILKNLLFSRMGGTNPPFAENSAKIINSIFEPFPYLVNL